MNIFVKVALNFHLLLKQWLMNFAINIIISIDKPKVTKAPPIENMNSAVVRLYVLNMLKQITFTAQ